MVLYIPSSSRELNKLTSGHEDVRFHTNTSLTPLLFPNMTRAPGYYIRIAQIKALKKERTLLNRTRYLNFVRLLHSSKPWNAHPRFEPELAQQQELDRYLSFHKDPKNDQEPEGYHGGPTQDPRLDKPVFLSYIATLRKAGDYGIPINIRDRQAQQAYLVTRHGDVPIVLDSGCSTSITPFKEDFIGEISPQPKAEMHGLTDSVTVKGVGMVEWPVRDVFGRSATIRTCAYYIPEATIRLCSTQTYFQEHKSGTLLQTHEKVILYTPNEVELTFPYNPTSNLPLVFLDFALNSVGISPEDLSYLSKEEEMHKMGILLKENHNLSRPKKELLLWHQRLGHAGFDLLKTLMYPKKGIIGEQAQPPLIPTWLAETRKYIAKKIQYVLRVNWLNNIVALQTLNMCVQTHLRN